MSKNEKLARIRLNIKKLLEKNEQEIKKEIEQKEKEKNEKLKRKKEKAKEYSRIYREENREILLKKMKVKVTCECGSIVCKYNLNEHKQSKKHQKYINRTILLDK